MKGVAILFDSKFRRQGLVRFDQTPKNLVITIDINPSAKLSPGLHGFHVHESGDLTEGCKSLCAHYNPDRVQHGGLRSKERHRGDLGNIKVHGDGSVSQTITATRLDLKEIIGRSVIVHKDKDDLGRGTNPESPKTGNSGERVLCGVIGLVSSC